MATSQRCDTPSSPTSSTEMIIFNCDVNDWPFRKGTCLPEISYPHLFRTPGRLEVLLRWLKEDTRGVVRWPLSSLRIRRRAAPLNAASNVDAREIGPASGEVY